MVAGAKELDEGELDEGALEEEDMGAAFAGLESGSGVCLPGYATAGRNAICLGLTAPGRALDAARSAGCSRRGLSSVAWAV